MATDYRFERVAGWQSGKTVSPSPWLAARGTEQQSHYWFDEMLQRDIEYLRSTLGNSIEIDTVQFAVTLATPAGIREATLCSHFEFFAAYVIGLAAAFRCAPALLKQTFTY